MADEQPRPNLRDDGIEIGPRPRPTDGVTPQQVHASDQLSGYMRLEAQNAGAYFRELLVQGFYRHEALELTQIQARERFYAIYTAKPTSPPK